MKDQVWIDLKKHLKVARGTCWLSFIDVAQKMKTFSSVNIPGLQSRRHEQDINEQNWPHLKPFKPQKFHKGRLTSTYTWTRTLLKLHTWGKCFTLLKALNNQTHSSMINHPEMHILSLPPSIEKGRVRSHGWCNAAFLSVLNPTTPASH